MVSFYSCQFASPLFRGMSSAFSIKQRRRRSSRGYQVDDAYEASPLSRLSRREKCTRGGKKRRDDKSILERWIGKSSPLARTTGRPNKINIYIDGHVTESRVAFFARCVQYLKLARVLFLHLSILVFFTFPAAGMIGWSHCKRRRLFLRKSGAAAA